MIRIDSLSVAISDALKVWWYI